MHALTRFLRSSESSPFSTAILARAIASSASTTSSTAHAAASPYPRGMVEIREYTLKPEGAATYAQLATEYADVRKALLPLMG